MQIPQISSMLSARRIFQMQTLVIQGPTLCTTRACLLLRERGCEKGRGGLCGVGICVREDKWVSELGE
jgi:hypothetical protein